MAVREGGQRLAGAGWRGDQDVATLGDFGPSAQLRFGGLAKARWRTIPRRGGRNRQALISILATPRFGHPPCLFSHGPSMTTSKRRQEIPPGTLEMLV